MPSSPLHQRDGSIGDPVSCSKIVQYSHCRVGLGDDQFTLCKRRINSVANFYRPAEVMDPTKTNALNPKYDILEGKVPAFLIAMEEVAAIIRQTMTEAG